MAKSKTTKGDLLEVERKLETLERYEFEPIKGYPMLHWKGKRPFRGTQYYPAQLKENHGEPVKDWMNRIYWGDNLQVMSHLLKEFRGKVDLIYIDPPFDSKADYKKKVTIASKKVLNDSSGFEEKQYTDIWTNDEYLQFMYERLILLRELLSSTGSLLLHADYHKGHLLRCLLDEVFGADNFKNEIILKRPISKNLQAQFDTISALSCAHDNVYLYSKSPNVKYKQAYVPYDSGNDEGYWHRFWSGADRETMRYTLLGIDIDHGQWKWKEERALTAHSNYQLFLKEVEEHQKLGNGDLHLVDYWRQTGQELEFLRRSESQTVENWFPPANEKLANTLWMDTKSYANKKLYPTQKHEELLKLILERFSNPDDLVLDTFMGSGTTQVAAMELGRRYIGADINLGAIQTTTKRLLSVAPEEEIIPPTLEFEKQNAANYYKGFSVYNVNQYDIFRNELEAKELLIQALEIQPLPGNSIYDGEKDGRMVKLMPVNRIATRADLSGLIANFNYKEFAKREAKHPNKPVEHLLIVCMGHEPDLKAALKKEVPHLLDVEIVDILRDKANLEFKREAEAKVVKKKDALVVEQFYPMNLLGKLSLQKEKVDDWRELVESIMVDWNYDGGVFTPTTVDVPGKNELVSGTYAIPKDSGTIKIKITDLLSESLEIELA